MTSTYAGDGESGMGKGASGRGWALEAPDSVVLFSRVLSRSVGIGVRTGVLAAAATAGAIVGLGLRHGDALGPFTLAGRTVVGAAPTIVAAVAGAGLHLGWMVVWGACFTLVAAALRGPKLLVAAALFATGVWALSTYVLPGVAPAARAAGLSIPQSVFLHLLLALGLASGMRLAQRPF
jgi:hypothetical protein